MIMTLLVAGLVTVSDFGAVGDGKTDDTAAIMKAYETAAKEGKTLYFPGADKVYLTRKSVVLRSGMTVSADRGAVLASASAVLEGGGQTIRRKICKDAGQGATSVEVDDATGLVPGQEITIWQDNESSYRETLADIVKVVGNTVHFDTSRFTTNGVNRGLLFPREVSKRPVVLTDFSLVKTVMAHDAVNCRLENLTIRSLGNMDDPYIYTISPFHQTAQNRPARQSELFLYNVTIDGSSQDGISTQGAGNIWVVGCTVRNVKHKGIHWGTSCDKVFIRDNLCENCGNAEFEKVSNNGGTGAMYFCVNNHRVIITGNTMKDCYKGIFGYDYRGFGEWDSDNIVAGNFFDNCSLGGCWLYDGFRLVMTENRFVNFRAGSVPLAQNSGRLKRRVMRSGIHGSVIADNELNGGVILADSSKYSAITGNRDAVIVASNTLSCAISSVLGVPHAQTLNGYRILAIDKVIRKGDAPFVLENLDHVLVLGCVIESQETGVLIRNSKNVLLDSVQIENCQTGVLVENSTEVLVRRSTFQNCGTGVDVKGGRNCRVYSNVFRKFQVRQLPVAIAGEDCEFTANSIGDFDFPYLLEGGVVKLAGSKRAVVRGNSIERRLGSPAAFTISAEGATDVKVVDNAIFDDLRLFVGDGVVAYRDPAASFNGKGIDLWMTKVETDMKTGLIYSYIVECGTRDFFRGMDLNPVTPRDQRLNFSSPGNAVRVGNELLLCCCSYPREGYRQGDPIRWGDDNARCYLLRKDLTKKGKACVWSEPELMKLKGNEVPLAEMGRMIDPYLIEDPKTPGKWWCFFKQGGISRSWTTDFKTWHYAGKMKGGENVCILRKDDGKYLMFHSPKDGIGLKESDDLENWTDLGMAKIAGRENWPWARGRLTAACVVDLRKMNGIGKYVMFFHGSGPGPETEQKYFDANASIAMVFSDDLIHWRQ